MHSHMVRALAITLLQGSC